jgi:hypothetical protein
VAASGVLAHFARAFEWITYVIGCNRPVREVVEENDAAEVMPRTFPPASTVMDRKIASVAPSRVLHITVRTPRAFKV